MISVRTAAIAGACVLGLAALAGNPAIKGRIGQAIPQGGEAGPPSLVSRIFSGSGAAKDGPDELVASLAKARLYDESGRLRNASVMTGDGTFRAFYDLAQKGHAPGVYQLGLTFAKPRATSGTGDEVNSGYVSDSLMEAASAAGEPRATIQLAAKHVWWSQKYAGSDKAASLSELDEATSMAKLAASQGGDAQQAEKLLQDIENLRNQDARAFAALASALVYALGENARKGITTEQAYEEMERQADERRKDARDAKCAAGAAFMSQEEYYGSDCHVLD